MAKEKIGNREFQLYEKREVPRDKKGRVLPGKSLNPGGIPKDRRTAEVELFKALRKVEGEKDKKFLVQFIEKAYKDKTMAIALLKKIIPDLKAVEVDKNNEQALNIILQTFAEKENGKEKD